jgi:hypothetical protein
MFHKSLLLVASVTFSTTVLAGMFPEDGEGEGIWRVSGLAGYFNQSNNLAEGTKGQILFIDNTGGISPLNATPPSIPFVNLDPDYDWAWGAELAYIFPSHKYDIQGSYLQLRTDRNTSTTDTIQSHGNVVASITNTTDASMNYDYASAEITFGMYQKYHPRIMTRVGYGLTYVNVEQRANSNVNFLTDLGDNLLDAVPKFENKFIGGGPKITLDGLFDITPGIGIVAGIGGSLLFGEANAIYTDDAGQFAGVENSSDKVGLGLDGKMGLRYFTMAGDEYSINIEAGYQGVTYPSLLQEGEVNFSSTANINAAGGNLTANTGGTLDYKDNYYNYGPYITLGIDFL